MNIFKIFKNKNTNIEKIIVGLGNFLPKYEDTKHNVGFKAIDELAKKYNVNMEKRKFNSICGDCYIENIKCLLLKPLTFMNDSGKAVEAAKSYFKISINNVIVLVDDISFEPGKIKIKKKGSAGTHNGLKSIVFETGEEDFLRIKIGVGNKPNKEFDLARWVLSPFNEKDKLLLDEAYKKVLDSIYLIVQGKIEEAMNRYN